MSWEYHGNLYDPVANWPLDDATLREVSGRTPALPLTVETGTYRAADVVPGLRGVWGDGSTVLVENTGDERLRLTGDFSVAFYVRPTRYPAAGTPDDVFTIGTPDEGGEADNTLASLRLEGVTNQIGARWETTGQVEVEDLFGYVLTVGVPCWVGLRRRGDDLTLFMSGLPVETWTATDAPAGGDNAKFRLFGGSGSAATTASEVVLSSFVVWNRALLDCQFRSLFVGSNVCFELIAAVPISSREIRAYFSLEPRHRSPIAGAIDALDRRAWSWSGGVVERAKDARAEPTYSPTYPDAWSVVVEVDAKIDHRTSYELSCASVVSSTGTALVTTAATHAGIADRAAARPIRARTDRERRDLASSRGALVVDASGDLAGQDGIAAARKRLVRRIETALGGHFHLPLYGVGLRPKGRASLPKIRASIVAQLAEERDLVLERVDFSRPAPGVFAVLVRAHLRSGARLDVTGTLGSGSLGRDG